MDSITCRAATYFSQRPELLKLLLMLVLGVLGLNMLARPYCEGRLDENSLPVDNFVINGFPCNANGLVRAVYLLRHSFRAYLIFYMLHKKDYWVTITHAFLLGRLVACCILPPSLYKGHLSALLNGIQRLLVLLFHLLLSFHASTHKPTQTAMWYLSVAPIIDVSSVGLFQLGIWGEAIYGVVALVSTAWLARNFARSNIDVDYKLPQVVVRQLASTATLLLIEKFFRPLLSRHGQRLVPLTILPPEWRRRGWGPHGKQFPAPAASKAALSRKLCSEADGGVEGKAEGEASAPAAVLPVPAPAAGSFADMDDAAAGPPGLPESERCASGPQPPTAPPTGPGLPPADLDAPGPLVPADGHVTGVRSPLPQPGVYRAFSRTAAAAVAATTGVGGGAAVAGVGGVRPPLRGYVGRTRLVSTTIKIRGAHPRDVAEGYQQRIARVLAASNLQLEGAYLREGCIELVVDARSWSGAAPVNRPLADGDIPAGRSMMGLEGRQQPLPLAAAGSHAPHPSEVGTSAGVRGDDTTLQIAATTVGNSSCSTPATSSATDAAPAAVETPDTSFSRSGTAREHCGAAPTAKFLSQQQTPTSPSSVYDSGGGGGSGGVWSPWRDSLHAGSNADAFSDGFGGDDGGGGRAVDVGELIRALRLPYDGLTVEHSSSAMALYDEVEVVTKDDSAAAAAGASTSAVVAAAAVAVPALEADGAAGEGLSDGLTAGIRASPVGSLPPPPLPPPLQLLSVSPRVLPARCCQRGGGGGATGAAAAVGNAGDVVELVLLVACAQDRVPELLVRSHGFFLPVTVLEWMSVGVPAAAAATGGGGGVGGQALDVLMCTVAVPLAALPVEPGMVVVEVRWEGQTHGSAVPLLLIDDAAMAAELQAVIEDWRGLPLELEDVLIDLACFLVHARRLRPSAAAAATAAAQPLLQLTDAAPQADEGLYLTTDGSLVSDMRERVSELGLHLLSWMCNCSRGAWACAAGRLRSDLWALGVRAELILEAHSSAFSNTASPWNLLEPEIQLRQQLPRPHHQRQQQGQPGGAGTGGSAESELDDVRPADNRKAAGGGDAAMLAFGGGVLPGSRDAATTVTAAAGRGPEIPAFGGLSYTSSPPLLPPQQEQHQRLQRHLRYWPVAEDPVPSAAGSFGAAAVYSTAYTAVSPASAAVADAAASAAGMTGGGDAATAAATSLVAYVPTASVAYPSPAAWPLSQPPPAPAAGSSAALHPYGEAAGGVQACDPAATTASCATSVTASSITASSVSLTSFNCGVTDPRVGLCLATPSHGASASAGAATALASGRSLGGRGPAAWALARRATAMWVARGRAEYECLLAAEYQRFVIEYTADLLHAVHGFTLSCFLILTARTWLEAAAAGTSRRVLFATLAPPLLACLPSCAAALGRALFGRRAGRRIVTALRLPQLLLFCVAGSLIAWGRFPAAGAIRSYQLGAAAFVGDGIMHAAASLALPIPALLAALVRIPVHVEMWAALGAAWGPSRAAARAAAVAVLSVLTSAGCHMYLLGVYRRRRACGAAAAAAERHDKEE